MNGAHGMHHRMALSSRAQTWHGRARFFLESFPWPTRRRPKNATPSAACTRAAASSFPTRGTSAAPAICRGSASRRWRPPVSGFAHSQGYADGDAIVRQVLAHFREIAAATDVPVNADFEGGFADDPGRMAENVTRCIATGVAGLSIEDFDRRSGPAAVRFRSRARPREGRARGDRQGRRRRRVHRAHRGLHPRPARPGRDHPPAEGLCRRRRRLPLFARHQDPRADRGDRQGGRAEADQFSQQRRVRLHRQRPRRDGRAPHQRRRHAGARRHACLHQGRRREIAKRGQVRQFRRRDVERRTQQILSATTRAKRPKP